MPIAILLISLFKICGLGLLAAHLAVLVWGRFESSVQFAFFTFTSGLLLSFFEVLAGLSLQQAHLLNLLIAGFAFAASYFYRQVWPEKKNWRWLWWSLPVFLLVGLRCLATGSRSLDANLFWFFYGKVLFYRSTFANARDVFVNPAFISPDYPKLISVLAGQLAWDLGVWNHLWPRLALNYLFICGWLGMLNFWVRRWPFYIFFAICFLKLGDWLWAGSIDAQLALFATVACLFIVRLLNTFNYLDLACSFLSLGMCGSLKNEGMLMVIAILSAFCFILWRSQKFSLICDKRVLLMDLFFVPTILWQVLRWRWHIVNILGLNDASAFERLLERLRHPDQIWYIINGMLNFGELGITMLVASFFLAGWWVTGRKNKTQIAFVLIAVGIYCLGLFYVFLQTPVPLHVHVGDAAARITFWPMFMFFAIMYWITQSWLPSDHGSFTFGKTTNIGR